MRRARSSRSSALRVLARGLVVTVGLGCGPRVAAPERLDAIDSIAADVRWLSDDAREGRGLGTRGLEQAVPWLAERLAGMGLRPAFGPEGERSFLQPFDVLLGARRGDRARLSLAGHAAEPGVEWDPFSFSAEGRVTGELVFAGYGVTAPELGWDDYAGLDVRGKVVLVLEHEPREQAADGPFRDPAALRFREVRHKVTNAREHGAAALLVAPDLHRHPRAPLPAALQGSRSASAGLVAAAVSGAALAAAGVDAAALGRAWDARKPLGLQTIPVELEVSLIRRRATGHNVCGVVPGRDPAKADEVVVVGAHYDHLGYGGEGSLAPAAREVHNGADDNASGTAAVLAIAAEVARAPLRRTFVACLFGAEELGLLGSARFVADGPFPVERIVTMLNLDMVGRLRANRLQISGVETARELRRIVTETAADRFDLRLTADGYGPSDHTSFHARGVPVLFLFTGAHADYHRPTDDADKLDFQGISRIAALATELARAIGDADVRPTPVRSAAPARLAEGEAGRGYGSSMGTIPDFAATDEPGVVLTAVRPGSPAEAAGLRGGDRLVRAGGVEVRDLYDLTYVLRARRPGEEIEVVWRRGTETLRATVRLEARPAR